MPLRQEGCCLAIWPTPLLIQVMSPRPASTSAVSTRRSTTHRGETAPTSRMALPPQSQPPKTPMVFVETSHNTQHNNTQQHTTTTHNNNAQQQHTTTTQHTQHTTHNTTTKQQHNNHTTTIIQSGEAPF